MKYIDEYRTAELAQRYTQAIDRITTRPWTIMEICGGQTHTIVKFGIDQLLPRSITLIHGPGCPVCVTSAELIDQACAIAALPDVIFCSFGDMLRVPGSQYDLLTVKALGGDVRIVYSPLDALNLAQANPDRQVVFFAVGFETTAPATAIAVHQAKQQNVQNFSLLVAHVLVPPALELLLSSPEHNINGLLAAGHVCTVMGYKDYEPIAQKYHIPIVVTGFEPADILQGVYLCVQQLEAGQTRVENQYARAVQRSGNQIAQQLMRDVFTVVPRDWRGIGTIAQSGLGLRDQYAEFDASLRFQVSAQTSQSEQSDCISGLILQGIRKPQECAAFGTRCTPEHPLGAPMVSSEGACAAYYYARRML
ncbi:hydrogenase formation protein HypD [Leptolyngbya sp. GGD]|uniref:hydrogenase formation protein HypD n=1 Tax=Leptolyngbya sp. GGD TaxID=2997907 RepID=UPI00227C695D|nr:hydrogenase formation protein HypD [Leptolyngbya sp. GGD]MCY6489018.1 hydrogenase formation protein HypD [Leptolyngbya sp. GGD]